MPVLSRQSPRKKRMHRLRADINHALVSGFPPTSAAYWARVTKLTARMSLGYPFWAAGRGERVLKQNRHNLTFPP